MFWSHRLPQVRSHLSPPRASLFSKLEFVLHTVMDNSMACGVSNAAGTNGNYEFRATEEQRSRAHLGSLDEFWRLHRKSLADPIAFWGEAAAVFYWKTPLFKKNVLNYNTDVRKGKIFIEWFKGASTNICYNALDRNVQNGHGEQIAYYWEGNDPQDIDKITYRELLQGVCRFANVLKSKGVEKGDMVAMYMPMIPELVLAMLACARIGAIHSVVFGGYSSESLADRLLNGNIKVLVTAGKIFVFNKLEDNVQIFGEDYSRFIHIGVRTVAEDFSSVSNSSR
ncbi:Acetyl-coenzyme A synthetase, cytoplasmic [Araneus ventricosus]|uniref:acetate--CoA ligase n=1 Tax=Araneus ventricosus TaxID=182803 RepID=A0A4Y2GHY5_ARAVE|nr:Acetyl-coenzyme A synthetase, cytoplasmic [Araneus ventricosus]